MSKVIEHHANGKLLITGEYLVLVGARALALPVRFGQDLIVLASITGRIEWESSNPAGVWFTAQFDPGTFHILTTNKLKIAEELKKLLGSARKLNPMFLAGQDGCYVTVKANYPLGWGLGSSSTLCSLVAEWAGVDAFHLFHMISHGSGYDIACASRNDLIYYTLTGWEDSDRVGQRLNYLAPKVRSHVITPTQPGFALREYSYFVYLGNKQDTGKEVAAFLANNNYSDKDVDRISQLASLICDSVTHEELTCLVEEHESIMSEILKRQVIATRFPAFPGTIKSLGAWGGDFAMFVSGREPDEVTEIIHQYGFSTIFRYHEIAVAT